MSNFSFQPADPIGTGRTEVYLPSWAHGMLVSPLEASLYSLGFGSDAIRRIHTVKHNGGGVNFGAFGEEVESRKRRILQAMSDGYLLAYGRNHEPQSRSTLLSSFVVWANIQGWPLPDWMRASEFASHPIVDTPAVAVSSVAHSNARDDSSLCNETAIEPHSSSRSSAPPELQRLAVVIEAQSVERAKTKEELLAFVSDPNNCFRLTDGEPKTAAELARVFHSVIRSPAYSGSITDKKPSFRRLENLLSQFKKEGLWSPPTSRRK